MVTRKLRIGHKSYLRKLGQRIEELIIKERGYSSLDAFSLEHSDLIAKPTLYHICQGKRDMKISTLLALAESLQISITDLLNDI